MAMARQVLPALVLENVVLTSCIETSQAAPTTHCDVLYADLAEAFAGASHPSRLAPAFGMSATPPAEINEGWDLSTPEGQDRWKHTIRTEKPWFVLMGYPCTLWNQFTVNLNWSTPKRRAILLARREHEKPLKELMAWTMKHQQVEGRFFMFENPPGDIWNEPEFQDVWTMDGVYAGITHSCQWGKVHPESGLPVEKAIRLASNNIGLLNSAIRRCEGDAKCPSHHWLEGGKNVKASQEYQIDWVKSVLLQLRREIAKKDPFRWSNVVDHDAHMTYSSSPDPESPFNWRYRPRIPPEEYKDPICDVALTDWAPCFEPHAVC
jgi:hypothetical protein